ncbi:glutamate--cysteine ligase [Aspergillus brunneoviolaceus CBS 621.78]|uniref:Glutamate cysteine ligase n=1 Tax=Aspergillus brunneoviolaceus CBS 621.78 TaxID=1450534 RepID=A0ACD1G4W6_9EURO|nr:glutamate cysteine ligase [Aspergillus brunneoviolaceus CBS 621.78]RAH44307.1 glutamate cysteine ligase [Aspergillus brunneoviolaceus CBS 621.78]
MGPALNTAPISWQEIKDIAPIARQGAAEQLLHIWTRQKYRIDPEALWGDEIEYTLINVDAKASKATLLLSQENVLRQYEKRCAKENDKSWNAVSFQPEWGRYMIEATPAKPYGGEITALLKVENNMRLRQSRRDLIRQCLLPNQHPVTLSVLPGLGTRGLFTASEPDERFSGNAPDGRVYHPSTRYIMATENLATRRQGRFECHIPVFRDKLTEQPFYDENVSYEYASQQLPPADPKEGYIYLDCPELGMGCCCIQVTMQTPNEPEARWLHDQLMVLGPLMLALTAATPIYKGYLVDTDTRWGYISASLDDRTTEELATIPPRYSWNRTYISSEKPLDVESKTSSQPIDERLKQSLLAGGMDEPLAHHFATVLSRDPIIVSREDIEQFDASDTGLFDMLYNSVWQHVRLKPPLCNSGPGWRVEFRPMEVQLTDHDNAAFSIFIYLLSRAITAFHLNLYIPIDKLSDSMERAQKRNAALDQKIWFRRTGWSAAKQQPHTCETCTSNCCMRQKIDTLRDSEEAGYESSAQYALLSMDEIVNGENSEVPSGFPGLINIVWAYLQYMDTPLRERKRLKPYLDVISKRASGELPTPAQWMRSVVMAHPEYRRDSRVGDKIRFDLLQEIISMGE